MPGWPSSTNAAVGPNKAKAMAKTAIIQDDMIDTAGTL
jgi:phosphoribosylpyrophosphate synthetase